MNNTVSTCHILFWQHKQLYIYIYITGYEKVKVIWKMHVIWYMRIDTSSNKNLHVSSWFLFCTEFDGISLTWRKTSLSISQSSPDAPRDYLCPAIGSWWPQSWVILTVYIYKHSRVKSEQVLSTYIYPTDNARRQFLYRIFRTYIADLVTDNNESLQNLNPECSIQT